MSTRAVRLALLLFASLLACQPKQGRERPRRVVFLLFHLLARAKPIARASWRRRPPTSTGERGAEDDERHDQEKIDAANQIDKERPGAGRTAVRPLKPRPLNPTSPAAAYSPG